MSVTHTFAPVTGSASKPLKTNDRSEPQCAAFYLALLIGGLFLFSAIFVSCSPLYPNLRCSATRGARRCTTWSIRVRPASPDAPCTLPRSSTAGLGPSVRSSIRRGACRHRIGGAASQALERGPGSLRPQARYRASRIPWSAPVLIRRSGSPQRLKMYRLLPR